MRIRTVGSLFPLLLLLGACAGSPQPRLAAFSQTEYAPYDRPGDASISGSASLRSDEGNVTSGGGCKEVVLEPVTSYSTEWFDHEVMKNERLGPPDPRALTYRRTTQMDSTGHFHFEQLPAGSFYLACLMRWDRWIMQGTRPIMFEEAAWVHGRLTLRPGEHGRVVLTH
jgi:hypothetical protein